MDWYPEPCLYTENGEDRYPAPSAERGGRSVLKGEEGGSSAPGMQKGKKGSPKRSLPYSLGVRGGGVGGVLAY